MTDPTKAVVPAQPTAVKPTNNYSLDRFPVENYNRVTPVQTLISSDLIAPVVQVVQLEPPGPNGDSPDSYTSKDIPNGKRALTARALNAIASTASVSFSNEHRIDDGRDPDVIGVSIDASMLLPTGQRITTPGSAMINLRDWFPSDATPAQVAKFRKTFYAQVATRAKNRAIRGLLSLKSSYPEAELRKPFAIVTFVPNTAHPDVRKAMLGALAGTVPALYGPEPARALGAGETRLPEAPEEDEPIEGECSEPPAPASADVPDWFGASKPAAPAQPKLRRVVSARLEELAGKFGADARSDDQALALNSLLGPLGFDVAIAVVTGLFGHKELRDIRANEAAALIATAAEPDFADICREFAAIEAAKGRAA